MVIRYNTMQQSDWTFAAKPWQKPATASKPVAKPVAVDPRLTELRRLEARNAELRRCIPLKAEHDKLKAELAQAERQLAERNKPKPRKGIRFSQGGFNVGRKPAA